MPINPTIFRVLRIARLMRALRVAKLVKSVKGVLRLLDTLISSIPALANVSALLFLVLFIYTVLGMHLFARLSVNDSYFYGMYNRNANFKSFHSGILMLFRMSTGELWCGVSCGPRRCSCPEWHPPLLRPWPPAPPLTHALAPRPHRSSATSWRCTLTRACTSSPT